MINLDLDPIAEMLERAGNKKEKREAVRELLQLAADHLNDTGTIADMRLRCWLVEYLTHQVEALPERGRGRPDNIGEQLEIAIRVETVRLSASADDSPGTVRGLSLRDAVEHVAADCPFTQNTVGRYHENLRPDALSWINRHGPWPAGRRLLRTGSS